MERVTILPIDIGQIKGTKVPTPALSHNLERKRDDFSQVLADKIQRKRNENSIQSGKEANRPGKKTTQVTANNKKQPVNHSTAKQVTTKKTTAAKNIDKRNENETTLQQKKSVEKKLQQSEAKNVLSKEKEEDINSKVDKEAIQGEQQSLTTDVLEPSEQLLLLLQNSDKTLTKVIDEEAIDTNAISGNVLNKASNETDQIIQDSSTKNTKDGKLTEDNSTSLIQNPMAVNDKNIKVDEPKITDAQNSGNINNSESYAKTTNSLDQKSQSLNDMMNAAKLLKADELENGSEKGLNNESREKLSQTLATTTNLNAAASLAELNKNTENISKADALSIEKLSADLLSGKQLTDEQLAQIALLKSTFDKPHKGETPSIVINDPINGLINKNKISDAVVQSLSTDLTEQQSDSVNPEKLVNIANNQLLDAGKMALLADVKKVVAEQFVLQPSDNLNKIDESTGYSEGELHDIQTLHSTSTKVTETNLQNQKIEIANKIDTISLHRKDFTTALQDKVMIMVQQKIQQVDIRLDPPELGHMQVRLNLHNDQTNVQFIVHNQQAKEALDQNLNKLKEMLSQQGVNVGDTNVGQRSQTSGDNQQGQFSQQNGDFLGDENFDEKFFEENSQTFSANLVKGSAVGVDYYA